MSSDMSHVDSLRAFAGGCMRDIHQGPEPEIFHKVENCKKCGTPLKSRDGSPLYIIRYTLCDKCLHVEKRA
jgi:hypothetical protein